MGNVVVAVVVIVIIIVVKGIVKGREIAIEIERVILVDMVAVGIDTIEIKTIIVGDAVHLIEMDRISWIEIEVEAEVVAGVGVVTSVGTVEVEVGVEVEVEAIVRKEIDRGNRQLRSPDPGLDQDLDQVNEANHRRKARICDQCIHVLTY